MAGRQENKATGRESIKHSYNAARYKPPPGGKSHFLYEWEIGMATVLGLLVGCACRGLQEGAAAQASRTSGLCCPGTQQTLAGSVVGADNGVLLASATLPQAAI